MAKTFYEFKIQGKPVIIFTKNKEVLAANYPNWQSFMKRLSQENLYRYCSVRPFNELALHVSMPYKSELYKEMMTGGTYG